MSITINNDNVKNIFIPWQELIDELFYNFGTYKAEYNNITEVTIKALAGGLSSASVILVNPSKRKNNKKLPKPIIIKIDEYEKIKKELTECINIKLHTTTTNYITQLLFPTDTEKLLKINVPEGIVSCLVYTYGNIDLGNNQAISSFDQFCNNNTNINSVIDLLFGVLNENVYISKNLYEQGKKPLSLGAIPWDTFLPNVSTISLLNPEWREFVSILFDTWSRLESKQNPIIIKLMKAHGDLRCANILIINNKPLVIDFGCLGNYHILYDCARLETDLVFRVALNQLNNFKEIVSIIETICTSGFNGITHNNNIFLQNLCHLRSKYKTIIDLNKLSDDEQNYIDEIYKVLLIGHATRFIRFHKDSDLIENNNRHFYVWFILRLFQEIFSYHEVQFPPKIKIPSKLPPPNPHLFTMLKEMKECGTSNFYWGPDRRNKAKKELLKTHTGIIKLLAHTGKSYLDKEINPQNNEPHGVFYDTVETRIKNDPSFNFRIILTNPYSIEGSKLGIAEARGSLQGPELDLEYHEKQTELFRRFDIGLKTYKIFRTSYPNNIELRISHYSPDATILMSDQMAFIEPYLVGNLSMRYDGNIRMNMPELLTYNGPDTNISTLYTVAEAQFEFLWNRAITLEEYEIRKEDFKKDFMIGESLRRKVVAYHESWFALDPIVGCPNRCDYCFLTPFHVNNKPPFVSRDASEAYNLLKNYNYYQNINLAFDDIRLPIPVATGNNTEMLYAGNYKIAKVNQYGHIASKETNNREILFELLKFHAENTRDISNAPIFCFITKQVLDEQVVKRLRDLLVEYVNLKIAIFTSISFLPDGIERSINHNKLLDNFEVIHELNSQLTNNNKNATRIACLHFWRPLLNLEELNNEQWQNKVEGHILNLKKKKSIASIIIGLKLSKRLFQQIKKNNGIISDTGGRRAYPLKIPPDIVKDETGEIMDDYLRDSVLDIAKKNNYPIFLNTSCALSYAFGRPDYNATYTECILPSQQIINNAMQVCRINQNEYENIKNDKSDIVRIKIPIDNEKMTYLRQKLGVEIEAPLSTSSLEWSGNTSKVTNGIICTLSCCPKEQRQFCKSYYDERKNRKKK